MMRSQNVTTLGQAAWATLFLVVIICVQWLRWCRFFLCLRSLLAGQSACRRCRLTPVGGWWG